MPPLPFLFPLPAALRSKNEASAPTPALLPLPLPLPFAERSLYIAFGFAGEGTELSKAVFMLCPLVVGLAEGGGVCSVGEARWRNMPAPVPAASLAESPKAAAPLFSPLELGRAFPALFGASVSLAPKALVPGVADMLREGSFASREDGRACLDDEGLSIPSTSLLKLSIC